MSVELIPVDAAEKAQLRTMFAIYLKELHQSADMEEEDPYFDRYWIDKDRWPYFITKDKVIAGFVLINTWSPSGKGTDYSVAEFYVLPEHRGGGTGKNAFKELLKLHSGIWEISSMKENKSGMAFWNKVLHERGTVSVEKIVLEEEVVLRFSGPSDVDRGR